MVVLLAAAYQIVVFGWMMEPFSGLSIVTAGAALYTIAYITVSPKLAAKSGCFLLLLVLAQRCCVTFLAPVELLNEQLRFFEHSRLHAHVLIWTCLGVGLSIHPHLTRDSKRCTALLVSATYLVRMAVYYSRTGNHVGAKLALLYICLPFCASFLLVPSVTARCPRCPNGRRSHQPTPVHVGSTCGLCDEYLATQILKPCNLGVCPSCIASLTSRVQPESRAPDTCPLCDERVSHTVRIWHLDFHDEICV